MAARKKGRKGPHRTRNWVYIRGAWKKIVYFDGYEMRQMLPDLDIMLWRGDESLVNSDFVPTDEIWIDSAYAAETDFQLKVYRIATMRRWTRESYKQLRVYLKQKLCRPGPIPPFVEREERDDENELNIIYVRGEIVRQYLDPHFMFGGHDLVYGEYITSPRTIWIDVRQDPREMEYTLFHETTERKLMSRSKDPLTYDDAHDETTARGRIVAEVFGRAGQPYAYRDGSVGLLQGGNNNLDPGTLIFSGTPARLHQFFLAS